MSFELEFPTLRDWCRTRPEDPEKIWWNASRHQITFVRNRLAYLIYEDRARPIKWDEENPVHALVTVISTHTSKSVLLPVYQLANSMFRLTMRENFHGWVVSVEALGRPFHLSKMQYLPVDFFYVDPNDYGTEDRHGHTHFHDFYAEGFPKDRLFNAPPSTFPSRASQFTIRIHSDYDLYMFIALLMTC